jgi:hypothetical protein
LIEGSRTNYLGNSEMLANWGFGVGTDTFTASTGSQLSSNPDGSSPAYHYSPSSTVGFHRFNTTVTVPTLDTNYVVSLFVKRVTAGSVSNMNRFVELEVTGAFNANTPGTGQTGTIGGSAVTFDMENLVIETETNNFNGYVGDAKIEPYPNGWYRLSYIFNPGIGINFTGHVWWGHCNSIAGDGGSETGNGNPSFYFWGASVENGSFPTSYIPTAGSSVTRAADAGNITGDAFSSFYNTTEGVLQTEFSRIGSVNNQMVVQLKDSDGSERIEIRGQASSDDSFRMEVIEGDATNNQEYAFSGSVVANVVGQFAKVNLAYKQNDFASTINGTIASTDNAGDVGVCDRVGIGYANYGIGYNGHIKNIIYYPKRLTNAQLQLLTS